jgi:hypothetical protein
MPKQIPQRTTKKLVKDQYVSCEFKELKDGDVFTLHEPNGDIVVDKRGHSTFVAAGEPYKDLIGLWTIKVKSI